MTINTRSVEETQALGAKFALEAKAGDIYALEGELGTGKTEFVRGFVNALAGNTIVRSPTFSIVNTYKTPTIPVYHFDFYRLYEAGELDNIGFEEYLSGDGVCLIEWGTMFPEILPPETIILHFSDEGENLRKIIIDNKNL